MSSQCKGVCIDYSVKICYNEKYYDNNRVFCRQCERFMKINTVRCPCCNHKFAVSEDDIYLDYDVDYDDSTKYVWEELPLLRSHFKPQQLNSLESK